MRYIMNIIAKFCIIFIIEFLLLSLLIHFILERREHFSSDNVCTLKVHDSAGLGDRLLDSIGYAVLCQRKQVEPISIQWCSGSSAYNQQMKRSSYSSELFSFPFHVKCDDSGNEHKFIQTYMSGYSYNPYAVAEFLQIDLDESLIKDYVSVATNIRPAPIINIPYLGDAVGVHLRKSDKITNEVDHPHETSVQDFAIIMSRVKEYILKTYGERQRFFICSEDKTHRSEFVSFLSSSEREFVIIEQSYDEISPDVQDFFFLSRCKEIIQCIKYSTFSMTAAIIGQVPLINFHAEDYKMTNNLINSWAPLLINHTSGEYDYWTRSQHNENYKSRYNVSKLNMGSCLQTKNNKVKIHDDDQNTVTHITIMSLFKNNEDYLGRI